ncbi:MAG: hypothetical protein H0X25_00380 [Acidobacteriales bacterium]|nr:hypothetical protein [Terriglobales bacterium]
MMTTNSSTAPGVNTRFSLARFARTCGFVDDSKHVDAVTEYMARLRRLPPYSRKLLAHLAELAYKPHADGRKFGAAYLPEASETCGLGVDEMYRILQELEQVGFIRMEGEYPFQDVLITDELVASWPIMRDLSAFCSSQQIPMRDIVVDLRTDLFA